MEEMKSQEFLTHVYRVGLGSDESYKALKTTGYLEEGQGSMGAFTVPTEASNRIFNVALEESVVRPHASIIRMNSDSITLSRIVDTTHASTVLGGIVASWTAEGGTLSEKNPSFGQMTLKARKLPGYCYTSAEWLDDSIVSAEDFLTQAFGEAIAFYADNAYINGTGVNEPLGVINAPCTITVSAEGSQTADTVWEENIKKMDKQLDPRSQNNAIWYINHEVKPQLYPLQNATPADSLTQPEQAADGVYLLGHKLRVTEKCPKPGDVGDIILADFRRYVIADRGLTITSSKYLKFESDQVAWRFVYRGDGQPIPANTLIPKNATSSLETSPFVILAARA